MKKSLVVLAALLLNACVGGIRGGPSPTVFDFGLPASRLVPNETWSRLALDVKSPPWFDSFFIDYRLAYEDPLKQREYAGSRWAGAPGALLTQRLRQQLGVVPVSGNLAVDCLLRVELQAFSQVFDSPQQSHGLLQANVSLIDNKRQLVAERQVTIEKSAITADAHGGVIALVSASDAFGQQLVEWLGILEKDNALRTCLPIPAPASKP